MGGGGARFRILGGGGGGGGGGGQGGPNSQQAHDVVSTSFRRHMPTRFLINQYQIITFLILKSDIRYYRKFKDRIERNSFASTFYFTLQLGTFVIFSCYT